MELLFIKRDTSEWDYIWLWLELHPINYGLQEPIIAENNNFTWEYMGSYRNNGNVVHEFIHNNHPKTHNKYVATLNASESFDNSQIEKIVKIN